MDKGMAPVKRAAKKDLERALAVVGQIVVMAPVRARIPAQAPEPWLVTDQDRAPDMEKAKALEMVRAGYEPPVMRTDIPAPGENVLAALKMGAHLMRQGE